MTVAQVAKALRRHPEVIREWIRDGRLAAEKYGPIWMVDDREVARILKSGPDRRLTWVDHAPGPRWHATREIRPNDTARSLCGRHLELTSKTEERRSPPDGADVCKRCLAAREAEV